MALAARKEAFQTYEPRAMSRESLTRELDWAVRQRELEYAGEAWGEAPAAPVPRRRNPARARAKRKAALRAGIPALLGILGAALVISLAMALLMGYIELTRLSAETVSLKSELAALQEENVTLSAKYGRMFDLTTVKEAAEAAGMTKPSGSQVGYLHISEGDQVTVYHQEKHGVLRDLADSAKGGLEALKEFFD